MLTESEPWDVVVLGAGWRGLTAALRARRADPAARVLVVEAAPQPGGSVRTQRTNGFVCELGPFAFPAAELSALTSLLTNAPLPISCSTEARVGHLFTGSELVPIEVDPLPLSFRSGTEEIVQACRRQLGDSLRLGRAVTAVDLGEHFTIDLAGEVPARLRTKSLIVALPTATAGRLLGRFDPALAPVAERIRVTHHAMVFFGGNLAEPPTFSGYGIVPAEHVATQLAEVIFCHVAFPGRALPGRFLVRCEMSGLDANSYEAAVLTLAETELRRWTGTTAPLGLCKVHTFQGEVADGALIECRARLRELPQRVPRLAFV